MYYSNKRLVLDLLVILSRSDKQLFYFYKENPQYGALLNTRISKMFENA